jgi:hypothetical protein
VERRIALTGDLGKHSLLAGEEMQLDEVAEELDEDDLAFRRVHAVSRRRPVAVDLHCSRTDRDHGGIPDGVLRVARADTDADVPLVLHDQAVALPRGHFAADDVVVAHEPCHELGRRLGGDRQRVGDLLNPRLVHHHDAVGHRERFFLVVRHVDEHQAELTLEVPQLDAHA